MNDNQLRKRLHLQIDRLSSEELQLLERFLSIIEEKEPIDVVRDNTAEYISKNELEKVSIDPISKTQEEWFQYFNEIEEGEFTPLEKANQNFEQWKTKHIKNQL